MGAVEILPIIDRSRDKHVVAEVDIDELQQARLDPAIQKLLQEATEEGTRVEREGRQRW